MNKNTKKCISISTNPGNFGVEFHNKGYELLGLNYIYFPLKVKPSELEGVILLLKNNFHACSISMPHKIEVLKFIDDLDASAYNVNAVNTILNESGHLIGFNTDYYGAKKSIINKIGDIGGKEVLLIGAGGVARAIGSAIKTLGGKLTITNRTEEKAKDLASILNAKTMPYERVHTASSYLLINATSVGLKDPENIIITPSSMNNHYAIMDAVIGNTKLISESIRIGKKVIRGIEMTVYQAEEQFKIYTGRELPQSFLNERLGGL